MRMWEHEIVQGNCEASSLMCHSQPDLLGPTALWYTLFHLLLQDGGHLNPRYNQDGLPVAAEPSNVLPFSSQANADPLAFTSSRAGSSVGSVDHSPHHAHAPL